MHHLPASDTDAAHAAGVPLRSALAVKLQFTNDKPEDDFTIDPRTAYDDVAGDRA